MESIDGFSRPVQIPIKKAGIVFLIFFCFSLHAQNLKDEHGLPNIIFYISDDLSASDISLYTKKGIKVPNIERLADEGMTFEQAYVASPSCAPSRAALLTGLYPSNNGALSNHTYANENISRLPQILGDIGYEVVSIGKVAHNINDKRAEKNGFDFYNKKPVELPEQIKGYFASHKGDKPVCLLVGDRRPHVPWIKKPDYPMKEVRLPDTFIDTKATREHWVRYATDIQGMDKDVGRILELAKSKFGENFVFIFSADHGSQWPFGKWNLYDYGINVPLVVTWPNTIKSPSKTHAMVSWVDIFPTLIDIAGGKIPKGLDGRSFLPLLKNSTKTHREYVFTSHTGDGDYNVFPIRSVRTKKFKYIENLFPENYHTNHSDILRKDGAGAYWNSWDELSKKDKAAEAVIKKYHIRPEVEFYDLEKDPMEQQNLINDARYIKNIKKLKGLLHSEYEAQNDKLELMGNPWPISAPLPNKAAIEIKGRKRKGQ